MVKMVAHASACVVALSALLLIAAPELHAQTADPAIIRAEAREVLIDVTVTTKKGVSAGDLTAKDFSIWEDGKPQKITSVSSAAADPETAQKHFVLFFDYSTLSLSDQAAAKKYAADFVDGLSGPDRFMAIASLSATGPRVLQDFTTAKAALQKALSLPSDLHAQTLGSQQGMVAATSAKGTAPLSTALEAVAGSLAPAPGRKALLLFTGGYSSGDTARFKTAIAACNRANVAVYVVTASAVATSQVDSTDAESRLGPNPGLANMNPVFAAVMKMNSANADSAANFAQILSDGTGGRALGMNAALPDELAGIAREQDDYYRVAYTPPPAKEGSCHALRLATANRALALRARNEYCTEKPVDLVAGRIAGQQLESRAASGAGNLDATMQAPYFYTGTNRASVHLSVDLVPAGMKFDKDKSGLHGQIDLVGTASRTDGGVAARFADTVNVDKADQQAADAFTHAPYHYEHQLTVAPGSYIFQMAIGAGPNAVGKAEMPLTVEPWNSTSLGIGGIAWSTEVRPLNPAQASGAPALEGRGPLVAAGRQIIPAATNRFHTSDHVYFYTEVYEPTLGGANPSAVTMQIRVLDRKTGALKQDTGMASVASYVHAGNPVVPFATTVQVAQLPPGSYRLEVRAGHSSGPEIVARTVDFELN